MKECKINHDDYKNNGLITKIWGGPGWIFNHSITFGYPLNPTLEQKEKYRNYFVSLGDVLPCKYCRESYRKFITSGKTALTDNALGNRHTLTKWLYDVHNAVNDKLEVDYGITYDDMVARYESFRARCGKTNKMAKGCVAPLDYKAFSFKKLYYQDAPIVPLLSIEPFILVAKIRGLNPDYFCFLELAVELNGNFEEIKKQRCWNDRNFFCQKQIRKMREDATPSIEESAPWKGTPTINELILMMFLSSNLNRTEIENATKALFTNETFLDYINRY